MTWYRLPVFVWSTYATSLILVLATPVLAMTLLMLLAERVFHVGIFSPQLGGDPLLFQHMFWFYSHPAVYIMILPSMGVISEVVPVFARKPLFGYQFVVWCSIAIAAIGFLVWGHHMFVAGQSLYASLAFSFLSYLVAVPSAIKVFNWTATLHEGWIRFDAPMLYAFGFIGLFTIGGLTGLFLAALADRRHVTDTYFVVAHFHYIMVGGAVMGYLRRPPLLVAEDHRPALSRLLGAVRGDPRLLRLQPDLLPAVHPRLSRACRGATNPIRPSSSLARAVLGRREHPRRRLRASALLFRLVDPQGPARPGQSVGRDGPRMVDAARRRPRRISRRRRPWSAPPYQI